jgi:antitoxin ParD1/3/4
MRHTVTISERHEAVLASKVAAGRFPSEGAALEAAIELLEERERELEPLRNAIEMGLASGEPIDVRNAFAQVRAELGLAPKQ